jgi:hypothetical protein
MNEKPPVPLSPEEEARLETERFDAIRDRRLKKVFDEFVATRDDLTPEQKSAVLTTMQASPEHEWGQVDGEDITVAAVQKNGHDELIFSFSMYGMEWSNPRCIKLP